MVSGAGVMAATAVAVASMLGEVAAAQTLFAPFPKPPVQLGPLAPSVPPIPPSQRPGSPAPSLSVLPPPPIRCTMRIIPVDPRIDPKMIKEPDGSVNYAKKKVPPPRCR